MLLSEGDIHEALTGLGDSVRLAQCRVAQTFPHLQGIAALNERARALRALLLEAIEALAPPRPLPFGSPDARAYDVLTLRYIERMNVVSMAEELSLSRRQVHRDLRDAEQRLAELLGSWLVDQQSPRGDDTREDPLSEELAVFSRRPVDVRLAEAVREARSLVEGLARERGVTVVGPAAGGEGRMAVADRAFLGQLLARILSLAVQEATGEQVSVEVVDVPGGAELQVSFRAADADGIAPAMESVRRMAQAGQIAFHHDVGPEDAVRVTLTLDRGAPPRLLVVEDNPGAVELYRRYLAAASWQVHSIADPRLAYDSARANHPDAIVLDIMMPHLDGWNVLRTLKERPETSGIPVVVCSVVNDPALALSLGAAAYLAKPVSQADLLTALHRCLGAGRRRS